MNVLLVPPTPASRRLPTSSLWLSLCCASARGRGGGRSLRARLLLRVDEGHEGLNALRYLLHLLSDLFGRELRIVLRYLEVRGVHVRFEVARLDDDLAARHALHVSG